MTEATCRKMDSRQFVRFLFLRIDPAWRRLDPELQRSHKREFVRCLKTFRARLLLRGYSLVGTRGDTDCLLWQVADDLEPFQQLETAILSTGLGGWLAISHSYLGVTRRSIYELPSDDGAPPRARVSPQDCRYLFVYPFTKKREWYGLPLDKRQVLMEEHIRVGRSSPGLRLNTIYSFGLDDQEFVLAFESDDAGSFVDLVMDLRHTEASQYTLQDTPIFTCLQMSLYEMLDALGGSPLPPASNREEREGLTRVASLSDLEGERGCRVYLGEEAIALFRVNGRVFAVNDRCTHGRASLSEGTVAADGCTLLCPWHGGRFHLDSGCPAGGPVQIPLKTYHVMLEGDQIFVG